MLQFDCVWIPISANSYLAIFALLGEGKRRKRAGSCDQAKVWTRGKSVGIIGIFEEARRDFSVTGIVAGGGQ
jgi:hypothetical protein